MNAGQMVDDVRLAVGKRTPVHFYGYAGGMVPLPDEIVDQIQALQQQYAQQIASHNGRDKMPRLVVPK